MPSALPDGSFSQPAPGAFSFLLLPASCLTLDLSVMITDDA